MIIGLYPNDDLEDLIVVNINQTGFLYPYLPNFIVICFKRLHIFNIRDHLFDDVI